MSNSFPTDDPFGTPPPFSGSRTSPAAPTGSYTPCDNGIRFGAYALDLLLAVVTCFIGWLIWSIILWQQGTSPAKKMLGLVGKTLLGSISFGITTLVGAIMILSNDKRQGIWDQIASTTVCRSK